MLETLQLCKGEIQENAVTVQPQYQREPAQNHRVHPIINGRFALFGQVLRFALVGGLNTLLDLLILNGLLWLFPTSSTAMLLAYSAFAFSIGAINSFLFNKYWTFGQRQKTTRKELLRFAATTSCGIVWSSIILWLAGNLLHSVLVNAVLWANASKVIAIGGTALISYLGMRLWVFVSRGHLDQTPSRSLATVPLEDRILPLMQGRDVSVAYQQLVNKKEGRPLVGHSLSAVLPAYNEEQVIASTVSDVVAVLTGWYMDFEVLVVNDGSTDRTGAIAAAIAGTYPQVHLITHPVNQGYGAALASGFAAATKDWTFFMDADGQFDIRDLQQFFPYIDEYEAVIGYRIDRQDSWMRKINAWGWKLLILAVLGVRVRDVDCSFKLLHTAFLRQHPLETRGAMINAELLYKLTRAGGSYREIGVYHHPRLAGRATGAKPAVILRALRDLFTYAWKWGVGARLELSHDTPIKNQ